MNNENLTWPPDSARPTEEQIRAHFGKLLSDDAKIMRPPYSTVWALEDGTLLWDAGGGYADIGPVLKCLMYLTGPQGSGKTTLVDRLQNSIEIYRANYISFTDIKRSIELSGDRSTIVVTDQRHTADPDFEKHLRRYALEKELHFYSITLKRF